MKELKEAIYCIILSTPATIYLSLSIILNMLIQLSPNFEYKFYMTALQLLPAGMFGLFYGYTIKDYQMQQQGIVLK